MINEQVMVDTLSGYELMEVLKQRAALTNCFEFITREQVLTLVACYNGAVAMQDRIELKEWELI